MSLIIQFRLIIRIYISSKKQRKENKRQKCRRTYKIVFVFDYYEITHPLD